MSVVQTEQQVQCPKCNSKEYVKSGFSFGKQRYKCKDCNCGCTRFTTKGYSKEIRQAAIDWYLEGSSLRSISRRLGINIATVINWIRAEAGRIPNLEKIRYCKEKI